MLLQAPQESPYDIRFYFLGFPIRISWSFWVGALVLGHGLCQGLDASSMGASPGIGPLLVLWALCVLISLMIHELGHALAFRRVGIHSTIVLYHFGGYAQPVGTLGMSSGRMSEKQDLFVTGAGPFAQLASAAIVIALVRLAGYQLPYLPLGISSIPGVSGGNPIDSFGLRTLLVLYLYPSIFWALLNLVPVYPMDGGRIARSLFLLNRGTVTQSLWLSIVAAAGCTFWCFQAKQPFMAVFFLIFAYENYQEIQRTDQWRF